MQVLAVVLVCFLLDCAKAAVEEKIVVARTRVVISLVIVVNLQPGIRLKDADFRLVVDPVPSGVFGVGD